MLLSQKYYENYAYLKRLGNSYKLIKCNSVKIKGIETVNINTTNDVLYKRNGFHFDNFVCSSIYADYSSVNESINTVHISSNDEKLSNNITRARNKIIEYVLCNDFVYFVTLTLNPDLFDRNNLKEFIKKLGMFIKNYNSRKNANIKYLFIPERHKDGCWHMHGFIMGLPLERLIKYDIHSEKNLPLYIVNKIKAGDDLYYFPDYEFKFGFNIFEIIRDKKASVLYMCKYLTKDISRNVTELGNHLYYCSKGLNKAEVIKEGQFLDSDFDFDFQNEYGGQSFFDSPDQKQIDNLISLIGDKPLTIDDYKRGFRKKDGWISYCDYDTGEIISNYPDELLG